MALEDRFVSHTPEQLILRDEAATANPAFSTLEGRALEDVRETIAYLAVGLKPETVLGGLMVSRYGGFDSTLLPDNDRGAIQIGVAADLDPVSLNSRGDKVGDVLEGLVKLGLVERAYEPNSVDTLLLPDDDPRKVMDYPTYRLASHDLPPKVTARLRAVVTVREEIDAAKSRLIKTGPDRSKSRFRRSKG